MCSPTAVNEALIFVEHGIERVASLSAANACFESGALARTLIQLCRYRNFWQHEVSLLIQWADLALKAAPLDISPALPAILRAASLCNRYHLVHLSVRTSMLLAKVFIREKSWAKARVTIESVTAQALEHSSPAVSPYRSILCSQ